MNDFDERYMAKVLAIHDEIGLERDNDPETRLWHLFRSVIEFCDAQNPRLDLDLILENVRENYRADSDWRHHLATSTCPRCGGAVSWDDDTPLVCDACTPSAADSAKPRATADSIRVSIYDVDSDENITFRCESDLAECFPGDADAVAKASTRLKEFGLYRCGGGAMAEVLLIARNRWEV